MRDRCSVAASVTPCISGPFAGRGPFRITEGSMEAFPKVSRPLDGIPAIEPVVALAERSDP
jgi:hypothetical protein